MLSTYRKGDHDLDQAGCPSFIWGNDNRGKVVYVFDLDLEKANPGESLKGAQ